MTPSTITSPARLDFFSTDKEALSALARIMDGFPLPDNVLDSVDPFQCEPKYLPDDVWCYVKCNGIVDLSSGYWKPKGADFKLYSDCPFTGWRTTYEYYEGQAPNEHKTAWVMQKYWMSQTDLCGNSKQKEASSLCKVFIGDEQFQNHEKIQVVEISIPNSEPIYSNHELVVPDGSNNMANGSASNFEVSEADKIVELIVAGKTLDQHLEEFISEMDFCYRDDDYIELRDLDNPAYSSSSSENSSCLSMSSGEHFDSLALLRDIEQDNKLDTVQRDAFCISSCAPSKLRKEVDQKASESLVSIRRNQLLAEENLKTDATVHGSGYSKPEFKLANGLKDEASSSSHNKKVSNGQETGVDGGKKKKKKTAGRMKKIHKKYFCFISF